jgi:shikimate dehydrogenase
MYNAAFGHLGENSVYLACRVTGGKLAEAVAGLKALGFRGGNVTIPFKEQVIPLLDGISEEAGLIGAVNTLYWRDGRLWGDNTDGPGFIRALEQVEPRFREYGSALLLGAGGSARAVAVHLALAGIKKVTVVNRTPSKALELVRLLEKLGVQAKWLDWEDLSLGEAAAGSRIIINTTPLGMSPQTAGCPAIDFSRLGREHLAVDLIYKPRETLFLKRAGEQGCRTMNGLGMLLEQGVLSFELWSGLKAPAGVMKRELERWL